MPKAGTTLHELEPGDAASKDAQIANVTAKPAIDTASVSQRIRPLRRPSALPTNSSSTAPATGSSHEIDNSGTFNTSP